MMFRLKFTAIVLLILGVLIFNGCDNSVYGSYTDWYLLSLEELE